RRTALLAAVQVDEAVVEGAAEIRLQRTLRAQIESIYLLNSLHGRLLHDVVGLEHAPRARRQPAPRPPSQARQIQLDQRIEGGAIARLGTLQELSGGRWVRPIVHGNWQHLR